MVEDWAANEQVCFSTARLSTIEQFICLTFKGKALRVRTAVMVGVGLPGDGLLYRLLLTFGNGGPPSFGWNPACYSLSGDGRVNRR
jgi:hypothetical protein